MMRHLELGRLELDRALVVFDLEATGSDVATDRIVEIAMIRLNPSGKAEEFRSLVDPRVPIPVESTAIHGIRDQDVAGQLTMKELALDVLGMLENADLCGFSLLRYDVPLLRNELDRAGHSWSPDGARIIDVQRVFHQREPRNLTAAFAFYCGKELVGAHGALADTRATLDVFLAQLERYPDLPDTIAGLDAAFNQPDPQFVDVERRFRWRNGEPAFNFGSQRGRALREVAEKNPEYLDRLLQGDFSDTVKTLIRDALAGDIPTRDPMAGDLSSRAVASGTSTPIASSTTSPTASSSASSSAPPHASPPASSSASPPAASAASRVPDAGSAQATPPRSPAETSSATARVPAPRIPETRPGEAGRVAVVSDGSAVPDALLREPRGVFAFLEERARSLRDASGLDTVPLVLDAREELDVVRILRGVSPTFAAIDLAGIAAPRAAAIEAKLADLRLPVLDGFGRAAAIIAKAAGAAARAAGVEAVGAGPDDFDPVPVAAGLYRGMLEARASLYTPAMEQAAAEALARSATEPDTGRILSVTAAECVGIVANAVAGAARSDA